MTAFDKNFFFLDAPGGEVENLAAMKAAGFDGVFCNVHSYAPEQWDLIRANALNQGMFAGPWARMEDSNHNWSPDMLDRLVTIADRWKAPLIVNAEKEIDKSGDTITKAIALRVGIRDAAISMQPWLFVSVDWKPVGHMPMLLQIFPVEQTTTKTEEQRQQCKEHAHASGCKCVYFTFGTYGGMQPADFKLQSPYSLFTGNACGGVFNPWKPTSIGFVACKEPPPEEGPPVEEVVAALRITWVNLYNSNPAKTWRIGNAGEWARIQAYWNNETHTPPHASSYFGKGLVKLAEARRFAEGSHG